MLILNSISLALVCVPTEWQNFIFVICKQVICMCCIFYIRLFEIETLYLKFCSLGYHKGPSKKPCHYSVRLIRSETMLRLITFSIRDSIKAYYEAVP